MTKQVCCGISLGKPGVCLSWWLSDTGVEAAELQEEPSEVLETEAILGWGLSLSCYLGGVISSLVKVGVLAVPGQDISLK